MERAEVIRNIELATAERDAWNQVKEGFEALLTVMDGKSPRPITSQFVPSRAALVRRMRKGQDGSPRGAEAVHQVLKANPGQEMDVKTLLAAVAERGWLSESKYPESTMSSAAARAWDQVDEIQRRKVGYGFVYSYAPGEPQGIAAQLAAKLSESPSTNGQHIEGVRTH